MRAAEIEEKVRSILVDQLGVREGDITPATSIPDDLNADSLDNIEIVMSCEEEFGIEIPDEDADAGILATPTALVAYIERRLDAKSKWSR